MRSNWSSAITWRLSSAALVVIAITLLYQRHGHTQGGRNDITDVERPIYNSTLGFQKIFILNLPSRTDHSDWLTLGAAVSDLHIDFIDGVKGEDVLDKVLPHPADRKLGNGNIGSWRAHMNALARIVRENITTALIMEDDVDWDIRIKQQMRDFSRGTRALTQPLASGTNQYADPSFTEPRPQGPQEKHPMDDPDNRHYDLYSTSPPSTVAPMDSPYGDNWDVLWPGSCAVRFPRERDQVPHGRFVILNEETMIPPNDYRAADEKVLPKGYPPFTRIVHHVWDPICTFAYAVSQRGARRILYEYGIKHLDRAFDQMMCDFCDEHVCLAVSPQLFGSHKPAGPINRDSDINGFGQDKSTEIREKGETENIQRSVRLNIEDILAGKPLSELQDQFPAA